MDHLASFLNRDQVLKTFADHVSPHKVSYYQRFGFDLVMAKREGVFFYDVDGRRFLNAHCNGGVFNMGHRHPLLLQALRDATEQLDIGNHHLISSYRARLAQRIAKTLPGDLDQVIFAVSGGEAIDTALKIARGFTKRPHVISAIGGYHGHTGLAMATGDARYSEPFGPPMPGFQQVPFDDLEALEEALDQQVAAVILETVPATLGITIPTQHYLAGVRDLCDQYGAMMVIDEVQTGLGRTGKLWGIEHFGVVPDILVTGKGLSGGVYPIAATCFRQDLQQLFAPDPFVHISTFGGAEIGCAVTLQLFDLLEDPSFLPQVNQTAEQLKQGLQALQQRFPQMLKEVRQLGMMIGLVLPSEGLGMLMSRALLDQGVFAVYSNNDRRVTQFLLPLIIQPHETEMALQALDAALQALQEPEMLELAALIEQM
ncbi:MAG: aspartate aminotransferase family protein [Myxococcales bacterium]|nr:aspartate aminotransferase family protein [Myxococcales bacterium]